jgi:hypothetical protein
LIEETLVFERFHEALDVQPRAGAFDRLQSALASTPVRPQRVTRLVMPFRLPRTGFRLAAAIAIVVIAAIVIGSFAAYVRSLTREHTITPPITSPSPGAPSPKPTLTQSLNVSNATPVILFSDAGNSNQIDGMTWDGRAGKVTQIPNPAQPTCQTVGATEVCSPPPQGGGAPPLSSAESTNPAGTVFVAFPYFYDRSGRLVATLQGGPYADPAVGEYFVGTWADDELHYCQLVPIFGGTSDVTGTLQLTTPGGAPHDVARVGQQAAGENTLTVTACSVLADRAVVVQASPTPGPNGNPIDQYWVVQLSSGHILWTHDVRASGLARVVASRDGSYVAEEVQATRLTTIYGPTGSPVGHVSGSVEAFSWDDSLALVVGSGGANVVRWNDGTIVWTVPSGEGLAGFQPEPGGTSFAIRTVNGALYVVSSSGRVLAQSNAPGLLGCLPKQCASIPASDTMQVLPQVMEGNVGWAGTQRTTDGGAHWRDASPPTPANRTKGGYAAYFLDANHGWVTQAVGAGGQPSATALVISATADGGQTWSQASVPMSGAATDSAQLGFVDARHGWLVTDSGRTAFDKTNTSVVEQPITRSVYATSDGGRTWAVLTTAHEGDRSTLGTIALTCSMNGLTFANQNDGWLTWDSSCGIGTTGPPPQQPVKAQVAVTHDGGRTWQPLVLPSGGSGNDQICTPHPPVFTSSQGVLAVDCGGISGAGFSGVYATGDGGRSWTFRRLPFFSQQLDFVDANTGWTFDTRSDSLYRTTDAGSHWVRVKQFVGEQNVNGLSFVSATVGFALTARYSADGKSGYSTMWKTADGGSTWSVMSTVPTGGRCC